MNKVYLVVPYVSYEGNMSPLKAFSDYESAYVLCNKLNQWLDIAPEYPETDNEEDEQAWYVAEALCQHIHDYCARKAEKEEKERKHKATRKVWSYLFPEENENV